MRFSLNCVFCLIIFLSGCVPFMSQNLKPQEARLGPVTEQEKLLKELPMPSRKVVAAVYKFRDQTGQYKPSEQGANWSTAVTQGATSILLRSLEESRWFTTIERENLGNLLNERKIIRSSRAEFGEGQNGQPLMPPLLFAGIILEGGIISYDANVRTGGAGLRYFGAGANGQYREDRVTVYLRAISSQNGQILKTVYTSKTVLSQMVDIGLFRFVKFSRLLEAETGFTYNEPSEIAVKDAIDKAVHSLILEGMLDGLWQAETETAAIDLPVVKQYLEEKDMNQDAGFYNLKPMERPRRLSVGLEGGSFLYAGDYSSPLHRPMGNLSVAWQTRAGHWEYGLNVAAGEFATRGGYQATVRHASLFSSYRLYDQYRFTPFITGGAGVTSAGGQLLDAPQTGNLIGGVHAGAGAEWRASNYLSITGHAKYHYMLNDNLDGIRQGRINDAYWQFGTGLKFYFLR